MNNLSLQTAIKQIKSAYSDRLAVYEQAKRDLANKNSQYKKLVDQYKTLIIKNANEPSIKQEDEIEKLEKQIAEFEKKAKIEKPKPACKFCGDTGEYKGKICGCVKMRVNSELIKKSGLAEINLRSLDECDFSGLDDATKKQHKQVYDFFKKEIINNFGASKFKNVLVCGTPGAGKTFLFSVVAGELLKQSISTIYVSAFSLNNLFLKYHTTFNNSKYELLEPLETCDCLLIDDLGTEPILNNVTGEYFLELIKGRVMAGKTTLINSNLMPSDLNDRYGERIFSRLVDKSNSIALLMTGKNKRI